MAELTDYARKALEYDTIISVDESLEYLSNRGNFMTFSKGLIRAIEGFGHRWDESEMDVKLRDIMASHGVAPSLMSVIRNWLYNNVIPKREFAIKICFAFEMTIEQATEFLNKVCFQNGFNPRRADEIIYFYCLKFKKSYSHATELLQRYKDAPLPAETGNAIDSTKVIVDYRNELIDDDERFIESLIKMKRDFIGKSQTALDWYYRIKEDIIEQIQDEADVFQSLGSFRDVDVDQIPDNANGSRSMSEKGYSDCDNSLNKMLWHLYNGISLEIKGTEKPENGLVNRNTSSLAYVIERIPYPEQLEKIEKKQAPVDRDTLLILFFFSRFYGNYTEQEDRYEDFYESMNSIFEQCGMRLLYPPNPLDWLVLKCVHSLSVEEKDPAYDKIGVDPGGYFNEILEKSFGNFE